MSDEYFQRLINVCVFIGIWLGIPYWSDMWPLGFFTWIPALIITLYLNDDD